MNGGEVACSGRGAGGCRRHGHALRSLVFGFFRVSGGQGGRFQPITTPFPAFSSFASFSAQDSRFGTSNRFAPC